MAKYLKRNRYTILFFLLFVGICTVPFVERITTVFIFKPMMSEINIELSLHKDRILSDLEILETYPLFQEHAREKNAEWVISQHIGWHGEGSPTQDSLKSFKVRKLAKFYSTWRLDEKVYEKLLQDEDLMNLNTDWITRLEKYDHWNFSTHREVATPLALVPKVNSLTRVEIFSQLPIANYQDLRSWVIIHFLQKAKSGNTLQGFKALRKVAELMHSSGTLIGNISAASILKDEYVLMSKFKNSDWQPKPQVSIEAYIRVSWAWLGLVKTAFFHPFPKEYWQYMKPENGICASARESAASYSVFIDFFAPRVSFESDFSANLLSSKKIFERLSFDCNHSNYSGFLNRSPSSTHPWSWSSIDVNAGLFKNYSKMDFNFTTIDNWIYLPFVRRFVGLSFFTAGSPINYTVHYETAPKKFPGSMYRTAF